MASDTPPQRDPDHPLFALGYAKPVADRVMLRLGDSPGEAEDELVVVAEETPVAFAYNGRAHAVMMATPADFEDFAVGFTVTERIVERASEIEAIDVVRHALGVEVHLRIGEAAAGRLATRPRNLVGRTSCGLCGVELLSDALREIPPVARRGEFPVDALMRVEAALGARQEWNRDAGSMHAAAWATADGTIALIREDVGRHNALDKVIGALARAGRDAGEGFFVLTSRASYELVQKVAVAGVTLMGTVSRPTGLAIRLAEALGITLVGLLKGGTGNVYADPQGVLAGVGRATGGRGR